MCVEEWIYFSQKERERWIFVDSITFPSPWDDLRSVWEREGGEKSLQMRRTKREGRGGDKKFD